jgi:hypothetical protein
MLGVLLSTQQLKALLIKRYPSSISPCKAIAVKVLTWPVACVASAEVASADVASADGAAAARLEDVPSAHRHTPRSLHDSGVTRRRCGFLSHMRSNSNPQQKAQFAMHHFAEDGPDRRDFVCANIELC